MGSHVKKIKIIHYLKYINDTGVSLSNLDYLRLNHIDITNIVLLFLH